MAEIKGTCWDFQFSLWCFPNKTLRCESYEKSLLTPGRQVSVFKVPTSRCEGNETQSSVSNSAYSKNGNSSVLLGFLLTKTACRAAASVRRSVVVRKAMKRLLWETLSGCCQIAQRWRCAAGCSLLLSRPVSTGPLCCRLLYSMSCFIFLRMWGR